MGIGMEVDRAVDRAVGHGLSRGTVINHQANYLRVGILGGDLPRLLVHLSNFGYYCASPRHLIAAIDLKRWNSGWIDGLR